MFVFGMVDSDLDSSDCFGREERKLLLDALEDAANEDTKAFFLLLTKRNQPQCGNFAFTSVKQESCTDRCAI